MKYTIDFEIETWSLDCGGTGNTWFNGYASSKQDALAKVEYLLKEVVSSNKNILD